jgi:nucleoid-associated protein YejK
MSANLYTLHWFKDQARQVAYIFLSPLSHTDDLKLNESSEINDKTFLSLNFFTIG